MYVHVSLFSYCIGYFSFSVLVQYYSLLIVKEEVKEEVKKEVKEKEVKENLLYIIKTVL